jgi:OOP family OmpA-OmpF porin
MPTIRPRILSCTFAFYIFATAAFAQQDTEGSSDHPLLSRYPDFTISKYSAVEFDEAHIIVGPAFVDDHGVNQLNLDRVEGAVTNIKYWYEGGDVSTFALFSNYRTALQSLDADIIFACEGPDECGLAGVFINNLINNTPSAYRGVLVDIPDDFAIVTGVATSGDVRAHIMIAMGTHHGTGRRYINQSIITSAALDTDKLGIGSLEDLTKGLADTGSVVLDGVLFDFDTATLQSGSAVVLDVLHQYLKASTDVDVFIVGHTDNVGTYDYNVPLSQQRAVTVVDALVSRGIEVDRMTAIGIGPVSPIALNDTDDGQALNRRVELVVK